MKYMLTIQHDQQKVAYIEFTAEDNKAAKEQAERIYTDYQSKPGFMSRAPYVTGNFNGPKPRILNHHVSKWIASATATNAWGGFAGGYWEDIKE